MPKPNSSENSMKVMPLALLFAALGWIFSPAILRLMATPAESFDLANTYLRVIFLSLPFGALNFSLSMGLRGVGNAKIPLLASVLTVTLDLVLNPLLIRGWGPLPALGIGGSAFASFLAGMGGMLLQLLVLYRDRQSPLRFTRSELAFLIPRAEELGYILTKGVPMGAQMLLVSSAQIVMIGLVNREGLETTAAYGASMQLWNYLQMPSFALGQAVSAMVAQAIGAKDHTRVGAVTRTGMASNMVMTGLLASILVLAAQPLLALFLGGGSPALPLGLHIQHAVTWSFVVMGASMVMGGTMRSYGVVWTPFVLMFFALFPVRLGFYFGMYPLLGSNALWWCFPVASCFSALATWWLYARGSWRKAIDQSPDGAAPSPH
jgi:putative MATE family efflux protein